MFHHAYLHSIVPVIMDTSHYHHIRRRHGWIYNYLYLTLQSVPITTKVVSSNPAHGEDVVNTTLCDQVCQWLAADLWFFPGISVSSSNKTDSHDIAEKLLSWH